MRFVPIQWKVAWPHRKVEQTVWNCVPEYRKVEQRPSYGEIAIAREVLAHTRLHVIIRPRGGDFLYSDIEIRTMLKDIEIARKLGADGVVFGCLTAEGEVDLPVMQKLMEAAQGLSVTFHRAFDVCRNPQKALEQIIKLGCNRILTSGQQPTAELGIPPFRRVTETGCRKNHITRRMRSK